MLRTEANFKSEVSTELDFDELEAYLRSVIKCETGVAL